MEALLFTKSGKILGRPDYTRWNKCKWYQKIIGKIFKRYKNKFIDVKGYKVKISDIAMIKEIEDNGFKVIRFDYKN